MSNTVKVMCGDLRVGMYVSDLDRPWLETPFLLQGFLIESDDDVATLKQHCQYVYVDQQRSSVMPPAAPKRQLEPEGQESLNHLLARDSITRYRDTVSWQDELPKAEKAVAELKDMFGEILVSGETGTALDVQKIKRVVAPLVDSICRNPDACIWLARIKSGGDYLYRHALGCSIWTVSLGRQLGFPQSDLNKLALGGLLLDIGKTKVDQAILNKTSRLSDQEMNHVYEHVQYSLDLLQESGNCDPDVLNMIAGHHERHNGKGYPNGLAGDEIPVFARIAAIADCYDAITNNRQYAKAISPSSAIKLLYKWKDIDFQGELVEEFIQAVGIYPTGTLVELSSGEIAIVVAESRVRRLKPKVLILLDSDKKPSTETRSIDLSQAGQALTIVKSLEPGAFDLDMTSISL